MIARRGLLKVLAGLIAAPAIVKASSLMPIAGERMMTLDDFSMRFITDYTPSRGAGLDVLYGELTYPRSLLTVDMITRETVSLFRNSNEFIRDINEQYEKEFASAKIGSQLRIRLPNDYSVITRAQEAVNLPPLTRKSIVDDLYGKSIPTPAVVALGAAAVLTKNPQLSRRNLFGGHS